MRVVFAGTPEPALPSLIRLIESARHDVIAVLTRPDAAAGRRGRPAPSPVAQLALDNGISGALEFPSAYLMKSPPVQHPDEFAREQVEDFIRVNARPGAPVPAAASTVVYENR